MKGKVFRELSIKALNLIVCHRWKRMDRWRRGSSWNTKHPKLTDGLVARSDGILAY